MERIQQCETNVSILSTDPDKIKKYKELLDKVIPIIKNSKNEMEKRAGYDFNILLKLAINISNNLVLLYLHDAIDHLLCHFYKELDDLLSGKEYSCNGSYELLHDIIRVIMQTILHKQNLPELREFCLQI
jgi:hypothetical protein